MRTHRRWHERWHVRVAKRCTNCGVRFTYPHHPGTRFTRERMTRIALLAFVFIVLAVVGPAVIISLLPTPDSAIGPQLVDAE